MAMKTKTTACPGCKLPQRNGPETTSGKCLDCDRLSPSTGANLGDYVAFMDAGPKKVYSETGLFWNESGMVNCSEHSPFYLSDTWRSERWTVLTRADVSHLSFKAACETCKKEASRG